MKDEIKLSLVCADKDSIQSDYLAYNGKTFEGNEEPHIHERNYAQASKRYWNDKDILLINEGRNAGLDGNLNVKSIKYLKDFDLVEVVIEAHDPLENVDMTSEDADVEFQEEISRRNKLYIKREDVDYMTFSQQS
jgi:hypothetical protein